MAQDFFIEQGDHDWKLVDGTTIILCETEQELTRQRVAINLKLYLGEWFADTQLGIPYFQSIFGKGTREATDAILKAAIIDTEGVVRLTNFESTIDNSTRAYSVTFKAITETGSITDEVTL